MPAENFGRPARTASADCALIGSRYTDGWATAVIGALVPVAVMPARRDPPTCVAAGTP